MSPWLRYSLLLWASASLAACACGEEGAGPDGPEKDAGGAAAPRERDDRLREVEPNNGPNQATPFALEGKSPGSPLFKPYYGSLDSPKDIDWYHIPAQEPGALRTLLAQTSSPGADLRLLWLVGGEAHVQNVGAAGGLEEVVDLASDQEVWIGVAVTGGAPGLDYSLTLARSPQPPDILLVEPDPRGASLQVPGRRQGLLNYAGDVDRFTIERGPSGSQETALRLEYQPPEVATHLVVRDESGQVLVDVQVPAPDPEAEGPQVMRWPNLALPAQGSRLQVEISAQDPELPGAQKGWTLGALFHGPVAKGELLEVEPGPVALPAEGARVVGYLHQGDQGDAFTLQVGQPGPEDPPWILHARAQGEDMDLALRAGRQGEGAEALDEGALGDPELICNQVVEPGRWQLEVAQGQKAKEPGQADRYKLQVELRAAKDEEIEPNHVRARATELARDTRARGFLYPARDADLWRFEVVAPKEGDDGEGAAVADPIPRRLERAAPTSEPASNPFGNPVVVPTAPATVPVEILVRAPGLNASLEVLDEDGAPVARQDARGRGEQERLRVDLPAGVYFTRVTDAGQRGACDEPYLIEWKTR